MLQQLARRATENQEEGASKHRRRMSSVVQAQASDAPFDRHLALLPGHEGVGLCVVHRLLGLVVLQPLLLFPGVGLALLLRDPYLLLVLVVARMEAYAQHQGKGRLEGEGHSTTGTAGRSSVGEEDGGEIGDTKELDRLRVQGWQPERHGGIYSAG